MLTFGDTFKLHVSQLATVYQFDSYTDTWGVHSRFPNSMLYEGGALNTKMSVGTYTHTATDDNSTTLAFDADLGWLGQFDDIRYVLISNMTPEAGELGVGDNTNMHAYADSTLAYIPKQGFNSVYTGGELYLWIKATDFATQPDLTFQYIVVYYDNTPS